MKVLKLGTIMTLGGILFSLTNFVVHADSKENTTEVTLNHNTYLYNKKGSRVKDSKKLLKDESVSVKGKIQKLSKNKKYYTIYNYQRYWLPYILIKGQAYYTTVKGKFIKVANVGKINNSELIATSGYVVTKKNTVFYNANGNATKNKVKKGSKFKVTALLNLKPQVADMPGFYQVSKNKFLYSLDVNKPRIDLQFLTKEAKENKTTYVNLLKNTYIRQADGTIRSKVTVGHMPDSWKVDNLKYIWVSTDNKAELFYHIVSSDPWEQTRDGYISAEAVKVTAGPELTPSNTAAEAEAAAQKK